MPTAQPLQLVADLLDEYAGWCRQRLPDVPTVEDMLDRLGSDEHRALVQAVGTTPFELSYVLNFATLGHLQAASLSLRSEAAETAFSVFPLARCVLEGSATVWWLCEHDPISLEALRRLASARRASDLPEIGRGKAWEDHDRVIAAQQSERCIRDLASRIGLGSLRMPTRSDRVDALLGPDKPDLYEFFSGLAHVEPGDIHHIISFAAEREREGWSRGVAVVAAVQLVNVVKAHGRAYMRLLEHVVTIGVAGTAKEELDAWVSGLVSAANHATPKHW